VPDFATRALSNINTRHTDDTLNDGFHRFYKHLLLVIQDSGSKAGTINPIVPYLNKSGWQDVQTKLA